MVSKPNVYLPGLIQVRPHWTVSDVSGHTPQTILWFLSGNTTTPTLANLQGIAATFDNLWGLVWGPMGNSTNSYTGSIVTDWGSNTGLQYNNIGVYAGHAGTNGAAVHSAQVAVLISYQIGVRYKGGHPRTYMPYVAVASTTGTSGDEVQSTVQTAMVTGMNNMINGMKGSGILGGQTQVIYRHRNDPVNAHTYPFATFTINSQTATQRRRLRKVPHH